MKEKIIEIIRNACAIDEEVAPEIGRALRICTESSLKSMNSASSIGKQWEILLIVWRKN